MAKVSVIVPVYNTEKYLCKCLDSLVNQTIEDIEIVLIDDGSTDGSGNILRKYKDTYPNKIKLISKENGGQATARNMGIKESTGEYIGFLDSDDYAKLDMFEKMYNKASVDNLDLVECKYIYLQEETNEILKPYGYVRKYKNQKDMFRDPLVSPWNKLVKGDILRGFDYVFPEGLIYEDTSFFIKIIPYVNRYDFIKEELIYHILRETSTMNANTSKRVGNIFPVLEDILKYYKANDFFEEYRCELEYFCTKIVLCSSMQRIARVPDKKLRMEFVKDSFEFLKDRFPKYRSNKYLSKSGKGIYMKFTNRLVTPLFLIAFNRMGD